MPVALGFIAWVTIEPTCASLRPSAAAFARSICTAMYGSEADRLLDELATTDSVFTCLRMASDADRRSASLPAVTSTSILLEAKPPCAVLSAILPSFLMALSFLVIVA